MLNIMFMSLKDMPLLTGTIFLTEFDCFIRVYSFDFKLN